MSWVGYEVHLTESCDDEDLPNLITSVRTTVATATDVKQLRAIQEGLSRSGLLPAEQLADFDVAGFRVDREKKAVTCPRGRESIRWPQD